MLDQYNVVIIGAGPAGAVIAKILAEVQISTLLIDCSQTSNWKIGEGLPPGAKPLLQKLGVWERFIEDGHLPSYGNSSAWGSSRLRDYNFIFDPNGNGWHLERQCFDAMLASAAVEAGAVRKCNTQVVSYQKNQRGGWQLGLLSDKQPLQVNADFVIDASGRASWFAKRQGVIRQDYDRLVGVVALLTPQSCTSISDCSTVVEATTEGWWYLSLLSSKKLVVAYMSDADLVGAKKLQKVDNWLSLLKQTEHIQKRINLKDYYFDKLRIVSANSSRLLPVMGESWLAVGDAAAAFDPLSSQGIITAIATGFHAATSTISYLHGQHNALKEYSDFIRQMYFNYLSHHTAYYALEKRWKTSPFWQRRHSLIEIKAGLTSLQYQ